MQSIYSVAVQTLERMFNCMKMKRWQSLRVNTLGPWLICQGSDHCTMATMRSLCVMECGVCCLLEEFGEKGGMEGEWM